MDDDESFFVNGTVLFDYKDFKTSGNILTISLYIEGSTGESSTFMARLRDITLIYTPGNDGSPKYSVTNKLKEHEIGIVISDGLAAALVFNPAILEKR